MKKNRTSLYRESFIPIRKYLRIMKLTFIFILLGLMSFASVTYSQSTRLTFESQNITIENVFKQIEALSEFKFAYNSTKLDVDKKISLKVENQTIDAVLNKILGSANFKYQIVDRYIIITDENGSNTNLPGNSTQQQKSVSGKVTDNTGASLPGVSVVVKGTTNGTITDGNGNYSISNSPEKATLQFSFVGMKTQEIAVGAKSTINVTMEDETIGVDEVIVTALGIKRQEKAVGYSTQKIKGENLVAVKSIDINSSLTGKIAGLNVRNSTEFNVAAQVFLRGETALIVIDGIPFGNLSLRDVASDDIESINILKGATASALYGSRGGSGAIVITTKRGNKKGGIDVTVNSSTMFEAGHLVLPKVQTSYSSGSGGAYYPGDYVWGQKLDAGNTARQYNPKTFEWEDNVPLNSVGKDNLDNFLQQGFVTNNNVSLSQKSDIGSFRASFTHVLNKGQYPNNTLNKFTFALSGDMKVKNFTFEGGLTYNKRKYPNNTGTGYGGGGFLYNLLVWTGSEYDIRDYKNYWVAGKEGKQQNWMDNSWYDNPWFIANEILNSSDYDVLNGFGSVNYKIKPWLNVALRTGLDSYSNRAESRNPISAVGGWNKKGYYSVTRSGGYSLNNDLLLSSSNKFGNFNLNSLLGGTIYYYQDDNVWGATSNGLTIPGFYSLNASVDPAKTGQGFGKKQVNSAFGQLSFSWKDAIYVDVTGRNDWSSTLPSSSRSYFYPSVSSSIILSEFFNKPKWLDMWKLRGSWTKTKNDIGVYETNNTYALSTNVWDGLNAASYPTTIRGTSLRPASSESYELGTVANLLKNRLKIDLTYFNKVNYDFAVKATVSEASGFNGTYVNSNEKLEREGLEITIDGTPVKTQNFVWEANINWSLERRYYKEIDPNYSTKRPWVKKGARYDWVSVGNIWDTDPQGNLVHNNSGMPSALNYDGKIGYSSPDWIWGFNNNFKYKSFTIGVSFDGRVGGLAYNWTNQALWNSGAHIDSDNQWRYDEVVNGKTNYVGQGVVVVSGTIERDVYGQVIKDNRVYATNTKQVSYENYIQNYHRNAYTGRSQNYFEQTFIKLREISLGYNFPKNYTQRLGLSGAYMGIVGQNLFLWAKEFKFSDPDRGSDNLNSPSMRYLGINIKFNF